METETTPEVTYCYTVCVRVQNSDTWVEYYRGSFADDALLRAQGFAKLGVDVHIRIQQGVQQ
jgi:hypothetical protein